MIKAVIFDLDGVLIDSLPHHYAVLKQIFARFGIDYKISDFKPDIARGVKKIFKEQLADKDVEVKIEDLVALKLDLLRKRDIRLRPGATELLERLKKSGYKIVVASGGAANFIAYIIDKLGISEFLDYIVTGNDVTKPKPNPEIFLVAASKLKCDPKECVVIEDADDGVAAAKAAGMKVIALHDSYWDQDLKKADVTVKSLKDVAEKVEMFARQMV